MQAALIQVTAARLPDRDLKQQPEDGKDGFLQPQGTAQAALPPRIPGSKQDYGLRVIQNEVRIGIQTIRPGDLVRGKIITATVDHVSMKIAVTMKSEGLGLKSWIEEAVVKGGS